MLRLPSATGPRLFGVLRTLLSCLFLAALFVAAPTSASHANPRYAGIVVDATTGEVLYEDSADARRYPASLTKMMTLFVLFEELEAGRMTLQTPLSVSRNAANQPPSKLGVRAGSTIVVDDAIKSLITRSANDVAVVIAENVSGSVPAFAERMTRTAHALGMTSTQFRNPNGLPDDGNYSTARDMMRLGVALQVRFPRYYPYFSIRSFRYAGQTIGNHNRLLGSVDGVDGIKTGFIRASGFNIVSSVKRDGRSLVAVVMGGTSAASRDAHMRELIARYLPEARRGSGFADTFVAAFSGSSSGSGGSGGISIAALAGHPLPAPRPMMMTPDPALIAATLTADPATGSVAAAAAAPVPPAALASATLPSAADAYWEPMDTAAMNEMIEIAMGDAEPEAVSEPPPVAMALVQPAAAVLPAPVASASGWMIQIGAVGSESEAAALLSRAAGASALAAAATPVTEAASRDSRSFVRARFGGFASASAAEAACAELMARNFECYAFRL